MDTNKDSDLSTQGNPESFDTTIQTHTFDQRQVGLGLLLMLRSALRLGSMTERFPNDTDAVGFSRNDPPILTPPPPLPLPPLPPLSDLDNDDRLDLFAGLPSNILLGPVLPIPSSGKGNGPNKLDLLLTFSTRIGPIFDLLLFPFAGPFATVEELILGNFIVEGTLFPGLPISLSRPFGILRSSPLPLPVDESSEFMRFIFKSPNGVGSWLVFSSPSMRLPKLEGFVLDLRKLGSKRLARGRRAVDVRRLVGPEADNRVDDESDMLKSTLLSVFSSSSHSLSEPRADDGLTMGDWFRGGRMELLAASVPGLAGMIASTGGSMMIVLSLVSVSEP